MTFAPRFTSFFLTPLLGLGPLLAQSPTNETLQLRVTESDGAQIAPNSHSNKGLSVEVTDGTGARVSDAAVVFRLPDSASTGTFADGSHSAVAYTDGSGIAHVSGIQWSSTPGPVAIRITATRGAAHAGTLFEENLTAASTEVSAPVAKPQIAFAPPAPVAREEAAVPPLATPGIEAPKVQILSDIEPSSRAARSSIAPVLHGSGTGPAVSITSDPGGERGHINRKKWLIIAGIAAAAGAGAFLATHHSSGSASSAASGPSIGAPTINIGR
jgi:hypothetical protein